MSKIDLSKNPNHNPNKKDDPRYERVIAGYRLVPMRADQVDEVARAEGRGNNFNVKDKTPRCSYCWLKTSDKKHGCRWRTKTNKNVLPDGGPVRQVPIYEWRLKKR